MDDDSPEERSGQVHDRPMSASRRRVLATIAASATLGAAITPAMAAASKGGAKRPHIVIIGGGFAGVTAARELSRHDCRITLVEARNRLGGRTFTSEFAGQQVDFGGTWVHWFQPFVWAEIQRYGIALSETKGVAANRLIYLDSNGRRHKTTMAEVWPGVEAGAAALFKDAYSILPRPFEPFANPDWFKRDGPSLAEKLKAAEMPAPSKDILNALVSTWSNAPIEQVAWVDAMRWYALSGYNLLLSNDATGRYALEGGTKALIEAMAKDCEAEIRLASPVRAIREAGERVQVVLENGDKLHADLVICTVPLNVLADVEFAPALNEAKVRTSRERHASVGQKFHVLLEGELENFLGFAPGGETPINCLIWEGSHHGKTHMIGFVPSREALDINDRDAVQRAMRAFVPDAKVEAVYGYDWNLDPYSKGTWGLSRPGQISKVLRELQTDSGKVLFASADWANGWRGFIDGAVEQGILASRRAVSLLRLDS